ncbi:MAG TPA: polysaccharide lyase family 8 super-sandwich domain-containing protein [Phycisphaerae bacterium]|nr:polysaccharide lyase family 8 super-sandwich domain-containing protein [Phycisphaerae bacterium]HUT59621.1 polysaccharide lyase family 8 super-sandwich domain-containing protein [Phycisphaerae bacterium]
MKCAAALVMLVAVLCASSGCADDMKLMRYRLVDLYTGAAGGHEGEHRKAAMASLEAGVRASMARAPATPEPDPSNPSAVADDVVRIFSAVLPMAQAYTAQGCPFKGSPELGRRIEAELARGVKWIKPGAERPGNWHPWLIQIPQRLGPALLLLEGKINPRLFADCLAAMESLMGEPILNGANAVWEARNHVYLALLRNDRRRMSLAFGSLLPELTVHEESGILEDYSYQFHGRLLHTSGYGSALARSAAEMIYLAAGTQWDVGSDRRRLFEDHLLEHARWVVVGDRYDLSVKGRGVLGSGPATPHLEAMMFMAAAPRAHQDQQHARRLRQAAAELLLRHPVGLPLTCAPLADGAGGTSVEPPGGFRHFYKSDFAVFRGSDFYVSARMYSSRLIDYEGNWGQNLKGWFLCYGMTYVSRTGRELHADRRTMRTDFDWDRLPGTTTRVGVHPPAAYNRGASDFAGGAGFEALPGLEGEPNFAGGGVCGFMLKPAAGDFVARKSCFFFDRGFAAAGSGVTSTGDHREHVVTTVAQWAAPTPDAPLLLSGGTVAKTPGQEGWRPGVRWAWCDNVGYVFAKPVILHYRRRGRLVTLWLDHGANPRNAGYAYVVLPSATLAETKAFAENPAVSVKASGETCHEYHGRGTYDTCGLVFWEAGTAGDVTVDRPAVVYVQGSPPMRLAVQNPLHSEAKLNLTLRKLPKLVSPQLPPEAEAQPPDGTLRVAINTVAGRVYRMGIGPSDYTPAQPRLDNIAYESFHAEASTTGDVTYITAHIPEPAMREGYRLLIRGDKGHLRAELGSAQRVGAPDGGTVRYKWVRRDERVRSGEFRIILLTKLHMAIDHFSVPPQP